MRRTRKTLYVVTSLYVFLGLVILVGAAVVGDPLSSFLGFVIVGGALGGAVVLVNIFRVRERLDRLHEEVRKLSDDFRSINSTESLAGSLNISDGYGYEITNLDLATLGGGEVSALTAATLDRDRFPRLSLSMDDQESGITMQNVTPSNTSVDYKTPSMGTIGTNGIASRNLLREWKIALRSHNLRDCQRIFSALVDLGDAELVDSLQNELTGLANSMEKRFRTEFSTLVNARQFSEALALGDEITDHFMGQPLEAQFLALRPALLRAIAKTAAPDQARIVQNR